MPHYYTTFLNSQNGIIRSYPQILPSRNYITPKHDILNITIVYTVESIA